MTRSRDRAAVAIAALGLLALATTLSLRRLGDLDLGWHLATGRLIVQQHAIPKVDDLAFTHQPLKYVEALSDLLFYGISRAFGLLGLQVLGALVSSVTACLLFARARRAGSIAFPIVALAVVTMGSWLTVRPATLSFCFVALTLLLLDTHQRNPSRRAGRLALFAIVPLQLVWANMHGFAPMGVLLAFVYLGHRIVARLALGPLSRWRFVGDFAPAEDATDLGVTAFAAFLALVATTLNTAGVRILFGPSRFDEDMFGITEWERPTLAFLTREHPELPLLLAIAIGAMFFGSESRDDDRVKVRAPRLFDLVLVVLACALAARAVRFAPVAALLVAAPTALRLHALSSRLRPSVAALATWLAPAIIAARLGDDAGIGFTNEEPEGAVRFIEAARPVGNMWNFMPFGGYLAYRLHPNYRVFIDGRNALARDRSLVVRARKSLVRQATFDALVSEFDMQWAITRAAGGEPFGAPLADEQRWAMTYLDDTAAVYVRRDGPNAALAAAGYRVLRHNTAEPSFLSLAIAGRANAADLAHDGALAVSQAPNSPRSVFYAACGALAVRDFAAVTTEVARLRLLVPGNPAIEAVESAARRLAGTAR